jgi:hypothetical protein
VSRPHLTSLVKRPMKSKPQRACFVRSCRVRIVPTARTSTDVCSFRRCGLHRLRRAALLAERTAARPPWVAYHRYPSQFELVRATRARAASPSRKAAPLACLAAELSGATLRYRPVLVAAEPADEVTGMESSQHKAATEVDLRSPSASIGKARFPVLSININVSQAADATGRGASVGVSRASALRRAFIAHTRGRFLCSACSLPHERTDWSLTFVRAVA